MKIEKKTLLYIFGGVAGCILLYWVLFETDRVMTAYNAVKAVVSPFVIGAVLAFILNVPMRAIENLLKRIKKQEIRRALALVITILILILVLALVIGLLVTEISDSIQKISDQLPVFGKKINELVQKLIEMDQNFEILNWVSGKVDFEKLDLWGKVEEALKVLGDSVPSIVTGTASAIGSVFGFAVNAVVSIVFAMYCLIRKEILARQGRKLLYAFLPEKWCDTIIRVLRLTNSTFSNFLSGQCLEVCILGCMFAISMAIFRMPYIALVSVLVAVTAFIPIVGAFAGCIIGALFIFVDGVVTGNPMQAVWFVAMFLVLQQIENNLIYPRVVGTSIGLPGMWVLLAVAVGGELMGAAGMFLMIPFAAVFYVLLREYTHFRLESRGIDENKLQEQPPELASHFAWLKRGKKKISPKKETKEEDSQK